MPNVREKKRTERVIVLLTREEKLDLERKARKHDGEYGRTIREALSRLPTPKA